MGPFTVDPPESLRLIPRWPWWGCIYVRSVPLSSADVLGSRPRKGGRVTPASGCARLRADFGRSGLYETPKRSTFEIQWRSPHPRSVMDAATSLRQSPSRKLARGFVASIELPAPHRVPHGSSAHVRCLAISFIVSSCSLSLMRVARCAA